MATDDDPASYASGLAAMTNDEVFRELQTLEKASEQTVRAGGAEHEDVLARIALVGQEIEQRFPGQALAPYKLWQRETGL